MAMLTWEWLQLESSNLVCRLNTKGSYEKKWKLGQVKWGKRARDLLLEFWESLHISGTVETTNFKFGMQIDHKRFLLKKIKIRSMSQKSHVTYF